MSIKLVGMMIGFWLTIAHYPNQDQVFKSTIQESVTKDPLI